MKCFTFITNCKRGIEYGIPINIAVILRTCTFKLQAVKLTKPLDTDVTNLLICASMSIGVSDNLCDHMR